MFARSKPAPFAIVHVFPEAPAAGYIGSRSVRSESSDAGPHDLDATMATTTNGLHRGSRHPSRKLRFDDLGSSSGGKNPVSRRPGAAMAADPDEGHSGRRFVVVAVIVVLATWGGLFLAFRSWRAHYRERAAFGASHVVSAIDPLKAVVPPDTDPDAWRDAVDRTHAMLMTVIGSNLLDLDEMDRLRAELDQFVARAKARPESARVELAGIWNEMADRAEFLFQDSRSPTLDRHARPTILPPRPEKPRPGAAAAGR